MNREQILTIVLSSLFLIIGFISLYFCYIKNEKARKIFKAIPISILLILVIALLYNHPLIYIGLLFGLFGDLFLLSFNKKLFLIGGICFLVEHILNFYLIFSLNPKTFSYYLLLIYFALILLVLLVGFSFFRKRIKPIFLIFSGIYLPTLLINLIGSIYLVLTTHNLIILLYVIGYFIFIISDNLVAYKRFIKPFNKVQFLIMSTYYLAQYLLYLYFLLILVL